MKPATRLNHLAQEIRSIDNDEFPDDDLNRLRLELAADVDELASEYEDRYGEAASIQNAGSTADDDADDVTIADAFEKPDDN